MLSTLDFWKQLARRSYRLPHVPELPRPLALAAQFDRIFGGLTRHRFVRSDGGRQVVIQCLNCDQADGVATDVCHTHMGLLAGLLEQETGHELSVTRTTTTGTCELRYWGGDR